jgi:hypothetical protein
MAVVTRIGAASAFKVGLMVYGVLGLLAGIFCSVVAMAAPSAHAHMPFSGHYVGLFAVLLCPILYGLFGGITSLIGALIYNLASRWVGGLQVELN